MIAKDESSQCSPLDLIFNNAQFGINLPQLSLYLSLVCVVHVIWFGQNYSSSNHVNGFALNESQLLKGGMRHVNMLLNDKSIDMAHWYLCHS